MDHQETTTMTMEQSDPQGARMGEEGGYQAVPAAGDTRPFPGPTHPVQDSSCDDPVPDASALDGLERSLAAVESAMARLDDGSYGLCEVCHRALGDELLEQDPTATHCGDHLPLGI